MSFFFRLLSVFSLCIMQASPACLNPVRAEGLSEQRANAKFVKRDSEATASGFRPERASASDSIERERTVTLSFPADASIGRLLVIPPAVSNLKLTAVQVAGAKGTETVKVPAGYFLTLEPNRRVFENPACLNQVSAHGLDCFKTGFTSLDDREDGMCDRAMGYLSHLISLKRVMLSRSDVTDAGMSRLKDCVNLEYIDCASAPVKGSSLRVLSTLPKLKYLNLSCCSLEPSNLIWLPSMHNLEVLCLNRTRLDASALKLILKCKKLSRLSVASNPVVTDEFIKSLSILKNLKSLDLRDTKVTAQSLTALRGINLSQVILTDRGYADRDTALLKKIFTGISVVYIKPVVDGELQTLLAPIPQ